MKRKWTPPEVCRLVGELVLTASALDYQLNQICMMVFRLEPKGMLPSIVATLDSARKVEMLKAFLKKSKLGNWAIAIKSHLKIIENTNKARNTAAHSILMSDETRCCLVVPTTARLLNALQDASSKTEDQIDLDALDHANREGQKAVLLWKNGLLDKMQAAFPHT